MKNIIRKILPSFLAIGVLHSFISYFRLFISHSAIINKNNSAKLLGVIMGDYHVIEKGLTMPNTRFNFGKEKLLTLISNCEKYINLYGKNNEQLEHAIGVILEYRRFHEKNNYVVDDQIIKKISQLYQLASNIKPTNQLEFSAGEYFAYNNSSFDKFALSRFSIRNYNKSEINIEDLIKAVEFSNKTPSSCNRQSSRVHIYTDKSRIKKILELQGGNRGFGHLADKLIVITSDLSLRHAVYEMSGPWVDGGMYAMSFLYGLHFLKIGACPLNCNFSPQKEKLMRKLCDIPKNEVFVVMISCGYLPEKFKIPFSKKNNINQIYKIHS
tara:strand:- start:8204 stop:9181 length:978 start_codon:yes stop_codon:yes gene_type:complete